LVVLDEYSKANSTKATDIKRRILHRCEEQQKELQKLLLKWKTTSSFIREPYPSSKLESAISLLSDCLGIRYDRYRMTAEIKRVSDYVAEHSVVPYRDSTTKNMILACEDLFLLNYSNESEREEQIVKWIESGAINEILACPIIDIDFSSCINDTTPEDDVISLILHQRSWNGNAPNASELVWNFASEPYRAALSIIVRFLRFSSRKVAYRTLHKETAAKRHKYDDLFYYFYELPNFVTAVCPDVIEEYPTLFDFNARAHAKLTETEISGDYFQKSDLYENETSYIDVFPH